MMNTKVNINNEKPSKEKVIGYQPKREKMSLAESIFAGWSNERHSRGSISNQVDMDVLQALTVKSGCI